MRWIWLVAVGGCSWISDAEILERAQEICLEDPNQEGCDDYIPPPTTVLVDCFADADQDGFGTGDPTQREACGAEESTNSDDCDDTSASIHPDAEEVCGDGIDQNCDGDDLVGTPVGYADVDGDGFGDPASPIHSCSDEASVESSTDCNDANEDVNPDAQEFCGNDIDENCDGNLDGVDAYVDGDGDGFGDANAPVEFVCESDLGDGFSATQNDCDDGNAEIYPGALELCGDGIDDDCDGGDAPGVEAWIDMDNDGFGDSGETSTIVCASEIGNGFSVTNDDCDDSVPTINPNGVDLCGDAVDQDCSGADNTPVDWYEDSDGDGQAAVGALSTNTCLPPSSTSVTVATDCDDADPLRYQGATELPGSGRDEDCDNVELCYIDEDGDGFGDGLPVESSPGAFDCDGPGEAAVDGDCDDTTAERAPDLEELCDSIDNDCNDAVDDNAINTTDWFADGDEDGFGAGPPTNTCFAPLGSVDNEEDCDDGDAAINPDAEEICNNLIDDNCNGIHDDTAGADYYLDLDGDGHGDPTTGVAYCGSIPTNRVANSDDCDDTDELVFLGSPNLIPGNGIDEDCDGVDECYVDFDGDGEGEQDSAIVPGLSLSCDGNFAGNDDDCNDLDPSHNTSAIELTGNNIDEDCDGTVLCFVDSDNDGYGSNSLGPVVQLSCTTSGYAINAGDCNDALPTINPFATEVPDNGVDEDCDGTYACRKDVDGDGVPGVSTDTFTSACVPSPTDCDDADPTTYPGAQEFCDGISNNCSGTLPLDELDNDGDGYMVCENDCDDGILSGPTIHPGADEIVGNDIDEDCSGTLTCYEDLDNDTYGSLIEAQTIAASCTSAGMSAVSTDCDDGESTRFPGNVEVCDGRDNDCNLTLPPVERDPDGDGYMFCDAVANSLLPGGDCGPNDLDRYPGAPEFCDNIDSNCDDVDDSGLVDLENSTGELYPQASAHSAIQNAWTGDTVNICSSPDPLPVEISYPTSGILIRGIQLTGYARPTLTRANTTSRILETDGDITFQNLIIDGGSTLYNGDGGCLYMGDASLTLDSVLLTDCSSNDRGGAVYLTGGASLLTYDSTFQNNHSENVGGAVFCDACDGLTFHGTDLDNNDTNGAGGAIGIRNSGVGLFMNGSTLTRNVADEGGAIWSNSDFTLDGTLLGDNYCLMNGGGIYASDNVFSISNSTFNGNESGEHGQALSLHGTSQGIVYGTDFLNHDIGGYRSAIHVGSVVASGHSLGIRGSSRFTNNTLGVSIDTSGTMYYQGDTIWTPNPAQYDIYPMDGSIYNAAPFLAAQCDDTQCQ